MIQRASQIQCRDGIQRFKVCKEQLRTYIVDAVQYREIVQDNKRSMLVENFQALSTTGYYSETTLFLLSG